MPSKPKKPLDEFVLSMVLLLLLPLLPLLIEFLLTVCFKPASAHYLERNSVMLTAPMFAIAVGLSSRFRGLFFFSMVVGVCLAVMYGAEVMQSRQGSNLAAQQSVSSSNPTETPDRGALYRLGMDDTAAQLAWYSMILMGVFLILERLRRHVQLLEPYEFEWDK